MRAIACALAIVVPAVAHAQAPPADATPPAVAPADLPALPPVAVPAPAPRPIVGFRVRGGSKVTERTLGYLAHVHPGDLVDASQISQLQIALMSSELFESAVVTLEDAPGGVLVVATLDDKWSWIAAPTAYVLPGTYSFGAGFAQNNWLGEDKKILLYAQYGNRSTLFFGTYLDPSFRGTPLQLRLDLYTYSMIRSDFVNAPSAPQSFDVARDTTENFLDVGALVGWTFYWWLVGDLRARGAYVFFRDTHTDDAPQVPATVPERDGWDITTQARLTADHRRHNFGLTSGAYVQAELESSVPGISTYDYQDAYLRAYYSWQFLGEHELELREFFGIGRHLPFHEELSNGGESDLRGYDVDQFRGDVQLTLRAEYSLAIAHWKMFAFRALGFWDGGYVGFHFEDPSGSRNYLPTEHPGAYWIRNDVGVGFRVYVKSVVLPLLGVDLGYGIEGHSPEVYFELGLTDF